MVFTIAVFSASWLAFIFFADKKKFFIFSPTCFLSIILGFGTDLITHHYPLWSYPAQTDFLKCVRCFLDDLGVYFVVTYLFLQTLPKKQTVGSVAFHIFLWTIPSIALEGIALCTDSMKHDLWWSIYYSYVADWILFTVFYLHHKMRLKHS